MLKRGARTLGLAAALVLATLGIVPSAEQADVRRERSVGRRRSVDRRRPADGGGQSTGGQPNGAGQSSGDGQSSGGQPNGGGAQQAPPPDAPGRVQAPAAEGMPQPTFRAGINFVRVDAIVTDSKGNPVTDLKAEDFTVTEDGAPQTVESFKLIKVDEVPETTPPREIRSSFDEESEAQREDVRLFAIFLDDYHVRRGAALYSHKPLADFLRMQLRPSDMVCVMYPLTPLSDLVMSRNHEAMARAVETVRRPQVRLRPAQSDRGAVRALPGRDRRAHSQSDLALRDSGARHAPGLAPRRAQGRHPRQRGLHQLPARRSCGTRSRRCRASATPPIPGRKPRATRSRIAPGSSRKPR